MTIYRQIGFGLLAALGSTLPALPAAAVFPASPVTTCAPDAALVGQTCVDKYEASVWSIPFANTALINRARKGKATLADLLSGGAVQISPSSTCESSGFPVAFPANGQWTTKLYAVSVAGVKPTACVSWFQADQACALSGKRLLTNAEWQRAVAGSPDPGSDNGTSDCNSAAAGAAVNTGSRSSCHSSWGPFDMVGNVYEWVADWAPQSTLCGTWTTGISPTGDDQCLAGAASNDEPGALLRGGDFNSGPSAGPFAVLGIVTPSGSNKTIGFRCAR